MQQSNVIIGYLTVAFIIFITLRGELPSYIAILRGGTGGVVPVDAPGSMSLIPGGMSLAPSNNALTQVVGSSGLPSLPALPAIPSNGLMHGDVGDAQIVNIFGGQ